MCCLCGLLLTYSWLKYIVGVIFVDVDDSDGYGSMFIRESNEVVVGCGGTVIGGGDGDNDGVVCGTFSICGDGGDKEHSGSGGEVCGDVPRDSDTFIGVVNIVLSDGSSVVSGDDDVPVDGDCVDGDSVDRNGVDGDGVDACDGLCHAVADVSGVVNGSA